MPKNVSLQNFKYNNNTYVHTHILTYIYTLITLISWKINLKIILYGVFKYSNRMKNTRGFCLLLKIYLKCFTILES